MARAKDIELPEDDFKVELEPLESEKQEEIVVVKADPPKKQPELSVDDGIQALKKELEAERQARFAAERNAQEATNRVNQAKGEVDDTNLRLIDNAIDTVKRNEQIMKQNLRLAFAEQDVDQIAEIQSEIATAALNKLQLEQGRVAYEKQMREAPKQQPVQQNDPVEALASTLSPRSADWVRRHPEYARDPRLFKKMVAAHEMAAADNIEFDTDEYFSTIERSLNIRNTPNEEQESPLSSASNPTSQRQRTAPPSAPVSRTSTNNSGTKPNIVRLSADEREMASMMGMTDQDYARHKVALIKEGKLN